MKNFRIEIKWGILFALMSLAWMGLEKALGLHDENISYHYIATNFIAIPAILIYYFGMREKRERMLEGSMTYSQAFISGLVITLVVTILVPLNQWITFSWITPDFFENMQNYVIEVERMTMKEAEDYFNRSSYLVQGLVGAPMMGIMTTAIVAIFVKKNVSSS